MLILGESLAPARAYVDDSPFDLVQSPLPELKPVGAFVNPDEVSRLVNPIDSSLAVDQLNVTIKELDGGVQVASRKRIEKVRGGNLVELRTHEECSLRSLCGT